MDRVDTPEEIKGEAASSGASPHVHVWQPGPLIEGEDRGGNLYRYIVLVCGCGEVEMKDL